MGFKMQINLGDTRPSGQVKPTLKSGVYQGVINKVEGRNGGTRAMFVMEVTNNETFNGATAVTSMKVPTSRTDGVLYYWRALAESCGYTQSEIAGIDAWEDHHFIGKGCYFEYVSKEDAAKGYEEVKWIIPSSYQWALQAFEEKQAKLDNQTSSEPIKDVAVKAENKIEVPDNPFSDVSDEDLSIF